MYIQENFSVSANKTESVIAANCPLQLSHCADSSFLSKHYNHNCESIENDTNNKRGCSTSTPSSMNTDGKQKQEESKERRRKVATDVPIDMPLRPLSAYNIFFSEQRKVILKELDGAKSQEEREKERDQSMVSGSMVMQRNMAQGDTIPCVLKDRRLNKTRTKRIHKKVHGKITLVVLAREVSKRWKALSPEDRQYYQELAEQDKLRHKQAMSEYKRRNAIEGLMKMTEDHLLVKNEKNQDQQYQLPLYQATNAQMMDTSMFNASIYPCQHQQYKAQRPVLTISPEAFAVPQSGEAYQNRYRVHFACNYVGGPERSSYPSSLIGLDGYCHPLPQPTPSMAPLPPNTIISLTPSEQMMIMSRRAAFAAVASNGCV